MAINIVKRYFFFVMAAMFLCLSGCAAPREAMRADGLSRPQGIYHKVKPKETLWQISKTYGISVEEIVRANEIPNAAHIQTHQLILIPQAVSEKKVASSTESVVDDDFKWPARGRVISYFGDPRSLFGRNKGVDIRVEPEQKIFPARSGEVVFADYLNGYGLTLILDHVDGYQTVYANNAKLFVNLGDRVGSQDAIAMAFESKTMAMLHFEIRHNAIAKNPLHFLP